MHDLKMTDQVAWHENDEPSKSGGVKMQEMKMEDLKLRDLKVTDQIAGHENAAHEIAGLFRVQCQLLSFEVKS